MSDVVQDMSLKYEGKVLMFHIALNTDQDPYQLLKALRRVLRGPRLDAMTCWIEGYTGEEGAKVWAEIQKVVVKASADPSAEAF